MQTLAVPYPRLILQVLDSFGFLPDLSLILPQDFFQCPDEL